MYDFRDKEEAVKYFIDTRLNAIDTGYLDSFRENDRIQCLVSSSVLIDEEERHDAYYGYPMWDTLWEIDDVIDRWIDDPDELYEETGLILYEVYFSNGGTKYLIGIDGCGYDFYKYHWIPLYDYLGIPWAIKGEERDE